MALLKIISGDSAGASFSVGPGAQRVGRSDANDLCLPDGSVSGTHCEISLDPMGNLIIRDLGSTNGTFIQGQRVREALVQSGQQLRLGNLDLVFENDSPPTAPVESAPVVLNIPPPPIPVAPSGGTVRVTKVSVAGAHAPAAAIPVMAPEARDPAAPGPDDCFQHPGILASQVCGRCGKKACAECTRKQKAGMKVVEFCLSCGGQCKSISQAAKEAAAAALRPTSMGGAVTSAFKYPFRGNGLILLFSGSIFFAFMDFLLGARKGMVGVFSISLFVITYGYLFAYMQKIVTCSAAGDDEPPGWPEVSDIQGDIVQPFFQFGITLAVSFIPYLFVTAWIGPLPGFVVMLLGILYFPMALLAVAMADSYSGLNPIFVLSSVMKVLKDYIIACVAFTLLVILYRYVRDVIYEIAIPVLPQLAFWFVLLISLIIFMRILGMLYYLNRRQLEWGL